MGNATGNLEVFPQYLNLELITLELITLELITAETQQIQKQFLEQLKHQEVQKQ